MSTGDEWQENREIELDIGGRRLVCVRRNVEADADVDFRLFDPDYGIEAVTGEKNLILYIFIILY